MGSFYGVKTFIDYVVIWNTEGNYFNFHNIVIYIIFTVLLGFTIGYVLPLTLHSAGLLVKFEWIFIQDFEEIRTKKYPNSKTKILVVFKNNESKDDKIAEIKGNKISTNKVNGALKDLKNLANTAKYMI